MKISLIVAMARNRVIGRDNALPWRLPADLAFFKRTTLGKPVLMGRKTFESIGRPLPGRTNIVITANSAFRAESCIVVHSVDEALAATGAAEEAMVIGGESVFRQTLPRAERIFLTEVQAEPQGDAWFPELDPGEWREVWREAHPSDARHAHAYCFILLERAWPEAITPPPAP